MPSNPKSPKQQTVILDSSVWISYLLQTDINYSVANKIVYDHYQKSIILVPAIVFCEVISVLIKLEKFELAKYFSKLDLSITTLSKQDFLDVIFNYKTRFKTKTQDTLILIHCIKYNVDCFETFDLKQRTIYNNLRIL
jgi:predicted nucleic acid-binding protein